MDKSKEKGGGKKGCTHQAEAVWEKPQERLMCYNYVKSTNQVANKEVFLE